MDFVFIRGSTPEEINENKFLWAVNASAKAERMRDFVGLDASNLMRIVATATELLRTRDPSLKKKQRGLGAQVVGGQCPLGRVPLPQRGHGG